MKKYLLFAGQEYYPLRGVDNFICDADSVDELNTLIEWRPGAYDAKLFINHAKWDEDVISTGDWLQIVDSTTMEKVFEDNSDNHKELITKT